MKRNIPNSITLGNLLCGFFAILINDPMLSPLLVLFGALLDLFDGLAARKLNVSGEMGTQLDSFADMVNFTVAPAFLYFHHVLPAQNLWSYVVVSFLPVAGALRLAKFNISEEESSVFLGLATPAAGMMIAFWVFAHANNSYGDILQNDIVNWGMPVLIGLLMVSPFKMFSFKGVKKNTHLHKGLIYLFLVSILVFSLIYWFAAVPLIILTYIVLSLIGHFAGLYD